MTFTLKSHLVFRLGENVLPSGQSLLLHDNKTTNQTGSLELKTTLFKSKLKIQVVILRVRRSSDACPPFRICLLPTNDKKNLTKNKFPVRKTLFR